VECISRFLFFIFEFILGHDGVAHRRSILRNQ